ncbi:hypothetical protein NQ314_016008 [Rhamnusium bicolor]|uniref:Cyclin N-terminal domain-containing protein n=1 Tax=Rhamnusium bicolor TaxID=1586634 RepID=A0AAV8WX98_9CUCU|nr:hypothetical protein NQ314_016008 [Rhamnusium bicolor]
MHRFYALHSLTHFPWHQMSAAALFLAAKVKEELRKSEHIIRVVNICRNPRDTIINLNSERYITQSQDLVFNENVLLQTLGFDLDIDNPHNYVRRYYQLQRTSKQESSFDAEPKTVFREDGKDPHLHRSSYNTKSGPEDDYQKHEASSSSFGRDSKVRSDINKVQTRDCPLKASVQTNVNSLNNYPDSQLNYSAEKQQIDSTNRSRVDHSKIPSNKHDSVRRHNESKPYLKLETDSIKKHLSASAREKTNAYLNKSLTSTSQKVKSPFNVDTSKSTPKQSVGQMNVPPKTQHPNENSNGSASPTSVALLSFSSPANMRNRNYSSSLESELRPVMKRIDQVECFENVTRDTTICINKIHQVPEEVLDACTNNIRPTDIIPPLPTDNAIMSTLLNGVETNTAIIRNQLKETPSVPHLPAVAVVENCSLQLTVSKQIHPQKEKYKHRNKEKSKEEKEKKKKHGDTAREKHRRKESVPTKTIQTEIYKYTIQPLPENSTQGPSIGLKIKIVKDKIKTENINERSQPPPIGGLKIKIPKEKINNFSMLSDSNRRKREKERASLSDVPQSKISKSSHRDSKQSDKCSITIPHKCHH